MKFDVKTITLQKDNLIEASAGTGKTYSIALLVLRLILNEISIEKILVVTFTEAATMELKERIKRFLSIALNTLKNNESEDETIKEILDNCKKSTKEKEILLKSAIAMFDKSSIFTIHGFCRRVITEHSFESGASFSTEFISFEDELLEIAVKKIWRECFYGAPKEFLEKMIENTPDMFDKFMNFAKTNVLNPDIEIVPDMSNNSLSWEKSENFESSAFFQDLDIIIYRFLKKIKVVLEELKQEKSLLAFDDLLLILYNSLKNENNREKLVKSLSKRYLAVLIDEFQDTDIVQYEIFSKLFQNRKEPLFLIGDPKQSIYGFRGADIFSYLKAKQSISEKNQFTMTTNYRSVSAILEAISTLFDKENPFKIAGIDFPEVVAFEKNNEQILKKDGVDFSGLSLRIPYSDEVVSSRTQTITVPNSQKIIISDLTRQIYELLNKNNNYTIKNKPVKPSDIAILTRSNNEMELVKEALIKVGIPAVLTYSTSVYETKEAVEMLNFLKAVAKNRIDIIKRAMLENILGFTLEDFQKYEQDNSLLEQLLIKFGELNHFWNKNGILYMFFEALKEFKLKERMLSLPHGKRMLVNFLHIAELLHKQSKKNRKQTKEEIISFLEDKIKNPKQESSDSLELRVETEEDAVLIMTLHKSKGLQFPIVFIPFLYATRNLKKDNKDYLPIFFHNEKHNPVYSFKQLDSTDFENWQKEKISEDLRLIYVGLTRAKSKIFLYWAKTAGASQSALSELLFKTEQEIDLKNMSDIDFKQQLQNFSSNCFLVDFFEPNLFVETPMKQEEDKLKERKSLKFKGKIDRDFKIASFTMLSNSFKDETEKDVDSIKDEIEEEFENEEIIPDEIALFPAGATPGTALHEIFEEIDFKNPDLKTTVKSILEKYGFEKDENGKSWEPVISKMVEEVLNRNLDGFSLFEIDSKKRVSEMEFFFPLKHNRISELKQFFNENFDKSSDFSFYGFMHGFIDLLFEKEGKYYIVDWKSNKLGLTKEDYNKENISLAMKQHNYHLQYMIYSVAVHKFLKSKIPNYSYEKHFGGVFYIFLRGVSEKTGIFFDRPLESFIQNLEEFLS